jgi:hypothetical protein
MAQVVKAQGRQPGVLEQLPECHDQMIRMQIPTAQIGKDQTMILPVIGSRPLFRLPGAVLFDGLLFSSLRTEYHTEAVGRECTRYF